ncbi:MAG: His-Xaa-Ser system radical SAM maturase HxsC [Ferrovibrio sp.]|uniref:His-Xaa-Ser system radical SAM maturase HxsC n=1 Tax=Ferrovibrio sp. TaxID=1917215 RepID=UPI00391DE484
MSKAVGLHTHAIVSGVQGVKIAKILTATEANEGRYSLENIVVWEAELPGAAGSIGCTDGRGIRINDVRDKAVVRPGDVIRLRENSSLISVLYRRGSKANTLFATERCNSDCIMCSQPPRNEDDSWRLDELAQTIRLIDIDEIQVGISGGEPTLLGGELGHLIDIAGQYLPNTMLHILSNGRLFHDRQFATLTAGRRPQSIVWAIPLYGDVADVHDDVVRASGSFQETLNGLYELGRIGARVEIRVVLHKMTVGRLPQLASFIYRRLPFVEHVALMGIEPMGFAKRNRDHLWVDPADYLGALEEAVFYLDNRGLTTSIYNLPLCVLPQHLWPFAERSISDWKNVYAEECVSCAAASRCGGFFASAGVAWRSRAIRTISQQELAA